MTQETRVEFWTEGLTPTKGVYSRLDDWHLIGSRIAGAH
jgi:hypothetical protein